MSIHDLPDLREQVGVFEDRADAGAVLANMLQPLRGADALVLAIPSGGVPVAAVVAESLDLPLDVAVVSKITFPWNPEAGYGAVAFDGTVRLHEGMIFNMGLVEPDISQGKQQTLDKVQRRLEALRGERPFPPLTGRTVILVDDGLASGMTMETAVEALRKAGVQGIVLAVPTGHEAAVQRLADKVDDVYCPNIRGGWGFAVADAYRHWTDVRENEALEILSHVAA
jgi:putative phosphoribosyl transferase